MDKFSIEYIVGLINRKEPLPNLFTKAINGLVDITFNRGVHVMTLEELLSQLLFKVEADEITPDFCLKTHSLYQVVCILQRYRVSMIPMSVPNNLPLNNTIHLLRSPELTQDPDIAAAQEIKKNLDKNTNYTKNQLAILQNTLVKLNNFNILSRVFEGLGAMQTHALDVNQRSALSNIINERLLPHDGSRYIRCLFGYVCDYGSYTYDYQEKNYVSQPIAPNLEGELIDIIARVLSASNMKLTVNPNYRYAKALQEAYNKYCPNAIDYIEPSLPVAPPQKVPVALRPLSKLSLKQKQRRLLTDLGSFKLQITDEMLSQYISARPGFAPEFITLINDSVGTADQELPDYLKQLNRSLLNDTNVRLMLPDLNKCELFIEHLDIRAYLPQSEGISDFVIKKKSDVSTNSDKATEGSAHDDVTYANYDEVGLNKQWSEDEQEDSNQEQYPLEIDGRKAVDNIAHGYCYTSMAQARSTGEYFNAISYTWDELTHFYCNYLIYSKDKDYLHPNEDEDYGANLKQFLTQPLKQIAGRLNQTNMFEFILRPMLSGFINNRQLQFFETQINNVYLFNNANPIPLLFCHGLFVFDKYLMQPKYHFNNEVFYLTLFAKEPYAINLYLTRIIHKYGNMLINIPEEFYILIILQMIIFPQDKFEHESFEIGRWLLRANFSHVQLSKVVILHYLAHQLYLMVHQNSEYKDLKLHLIMDANLRDALISQQRNLSNKMVSTKPIRSNKGNVPVYALSPSEVFEQNNAGRFEPEKSSSVDTNDEYEGEEFVYTRKSNPHYVFSVLHDSIFDPDEHLATSGYRKRRKRKDEVIPDECNQHLNKIFMGELDLQYDKTSPFGETLTQELFDKYITPLLKRVISSEHRHIYMFDRIVDVKRLLDKVLEKIKQKQIPDTTLESLPTNRFIIDSFVLKDNEQQLRGLQALALEASTATDIGFAHGIQTEYINEVSEIIFHNLHLQLVPNYLIFEEGDNYAKLRPVVNYIQLIAVPEIFQQPKLYAGYKDILFSLQCAAVALELIRALSSQILKPRDLIETLVKDVIATHNLQSYREVIAFTYNYINASYKLIDKEGRLNIDALCEDKSRLDLILVGNKGHKRLYRMLTIALNHQVTTNKITTTFKERYVKLLVKLKIKEASLLNMVKQFDTAEGGVNSTDAVMPRIITLDMEKIKTKLQESSEVQAVITKVREEEAERETQELEKEQQALKDRIAQYQMQQSAAGTTPTDVDKEAITKKEQPEHETEHETDSELPPTVQGLTKRAGGFHPFLGSIGVAYGGIPANSVKTKASSEQSLSAKTQQKINDLAPVAKLLSAKARSVVEDVALQNIEVMDIREFNGLCVSHRYMSADAAIEEINETCFDAYEDLLFDADHESGLVYITMDVLEKLNQECITFKELTQ